MLKRVFVRNGAFMSTKPNGTPYSLPFLKYIVRVLHYFPIDLPDSLCEWHESESEKIVAEINYSIAYISDNICKWFSRRHRNSDDVQHATQNDSKISKEEHVCMWQERQTKAIEIIQNDCSKTSSAGCKINKATVYQHFQARCKRVLENTPIPPWRDEVDIPPPEWSPPDLTFSVEETADTIRSLPTRRAPGPDGVTYAFVKRHKQELAPVFTQIMNICAVNKRIPMDWKHAVISLVQKKNGDPNQIEDWRPISLLCTSYKLYMKMIQRKLMPWIVETGRLSRSQGLNVSRSQGLKVSRSQGFKVSRSQGLKVSRSQGLKVSRSQGGG